MSEDPKSPSTLDPPGQTAPAPAAPPRPILLRPPAPSTIISPPTPIEPGADHRAIFSTSPTNSEPEDYEQVVEYDSPEDEDDTPPKTISPSHKPRATSDCNSLSGPMAASKLSSSPQNEPALLQPHSPALSGTLSTSDHHPLSPRAPSPSSPHYRPKPTHHRRTSSTHRVRETMDGEQRKTEDGERMVNQYRIGKSLGSGAYAKVELGVDAGTGQEYVGSCHPPTSLFDSRI